MSFPNAPSHSIKKKNFFLVWKFFVVVEEEIMQAECLSVGRYDYGLKSNLFLLMIMYKEKLLFQYFSVEI